MNKHLALKEKPKTEVDYTLIIIVVLFWAKAIIEVAKV
jgi:hypothetical protein